MGIFDFFKSKKISPQSFASGSYFETDISEEDLRSILPLIIAIFEENTGFDSSQLIDQIKVHIPHENLALAFYRFIPIAYCRLFIPEVKYSDEYVVYKTGIEKKAFSFSKDKIYNIILDESRKRFRQTFSQEKLLNILNHSSDFNAINQALNNGSKLQNLIFSPNYFL